MVRVIDALAEVHLQCVSSTARRKTLLQRLPYVPQMRLNTISHLRAIKPPIWTQVDADGGPNTRSAALTVLVVLLVEYVCTTYTYLLCAAGASCSST